ncbi:hypothetical protein HK405_004721 [Cladochytrium tenue]|nr:hypothetical protein HK405_004721 [Cladochytrium tenue]
MHTIQVSSEQDESHNGRDAFFGLLDEDDDRWDVPRLADYPAGFPVGVVLDGVALDDSSPYDDLAEAAGSINGKDHEEALAALADELDARVRDQELRGLLDRADAGDKAVLEELAAKAEGDPSLSMWLEDYFSDLAARQKEAGVTSGGMAGGRTSSPDDDDDNEDDGEFAGYEYQGGSPIGAGEEEGDLEFFDEDGQPIIYVDDNGEYFYADGTPADVEDGGDGFDVYADFGDEGFDDAAAAGGHAVPRPPRRNPAAAG